MRNILSLRHIFFLTIYTGFTLLLSGCQWVMMNPKGIIAADEKHIFLISVALMLIVVVPVILLTFIFAWRYRASNTRATYAPNWSHSTLLEIIWWSIPCVIIIILGVITWRTSHQLDPYRNLVVKDHEALTIEAIALEWKWLFIYPAQHIATVDFVQIPVNTPVRFLITAEGPMNSIQIPQLGGQMYAMAGMKTKLNLIADEVGDYQGLSTNFSGDGFADMTFTVRVSSETQFDAWVKAIQHSANPLTTTAYNQLIRPSVPPHAIYFSAASKDLFDSVVMKEMMPMPQPRLAIEFENKIAR